jgi:MFS family permease
LRGRVMGIYILLFFGLSPIGSLILGIMADHLTEPITVLISGVVLLLITTLIRLTAPEIQRLD